MTWTAATEAHVTNIRATWTDSAGQRWEWVQAEEPTSTSEPESAMSSITSDNGNAHRARIEEPE